MNKLNVVLLILVLIFGGGVVYIQDHTRMLHSHLNKAEKEAQQIKQERARLILLQAKHSNHNVVKEAAAAQHLRTPNVQETQIIDLAR